MIELENLTKVFNEKGKNVTAVQDVCLSIEKGDIFGIIGYSGAGKSTLVRCINLLERPTSGNVIVEKENMLNLSPKELRSKRKKIGMIFQHFNLLPSRTVFQNVAYSLNRSGYTKNEISNKVLDLLKLVDIHEKKDVYPSQLSGGQKQRVAIARALVNDPHILLCDEATSALDPKTTKSILHLLLRLKEKLNLTVVVITHEMDVVKEICNKVAIMENGTIVEQGKVFDIFSNPTKEISRDFIQTTSNLHKVEELILSNSSVVQLNKGEKIVRLNYIKKNTSEALISNISRKFDIDVNIIYADIELIQSAPIGGTVAIISGYENNIMAAIDYLTKKNVGVEVIKDASNFD